MICFRLCGLKDEGYAWENHWTNLVQLFHPFSMIQERRSRCATRIDMQTILLLGDRSRVWCWHLLWNNHLMLFPARLRRFSCGWSLQKADNRFRFVFALLSNGFWWHLIFSSRIVHTCIVFTYLRQNYTQIFTCNSFPIRFWFRNPRHADIFLFSKILFRCGVKATSLNLWEFFIFRFYFQSFDFYFRELRVSQLRFR